MIPLNDPIVSLTMPYQVPTLFESIQYAFYTAVAIASATPIVARVWRSYKNQCDKEPPESYETPCEYRYPIEEATDDGDIPTFSYVMEYTPNGTVLMKYNVENEQFEYWGSRSVQYKYLETVARKFVTMYHCSRIYHDWNPYEKKEENEEKVETSDATDTADTADMTNPVEEKKEPTESTESVFASFKSYNTQQRQNNNKDTQKVRNHYVHKGTLAEWYTLPQSKTETTQHTNVGIDFSTYKSMFFT